MKMSGSFKMVVEKLKEEKYITVVVQMRFSPVSLFRHVPHKSLKMFVESKKNPLLASCAHLTLCQV